MARSGMTFCLSGDVHGVPRETLDERAPTSGVPRKGGNRALAGVCPRAVYPIVPGEARRYFAPWPAVLLTAAHFSISRSM